MWNRRVVGPARYGHRRPRHVLMGDRARHTRETHYCSDCCYDVLDGDHVVGTVNSEGIYHGPAPERQRLGYISRDPLDGRTYLRLDQALERAGVVRGLVIELDVGGTLLLVEQIPSDFRPWRWPP